jgi:hypothetical protein
MIRNLLHTFFFASLLTFLASGQAPSSFSQYEDTLKKIGPIILNGENDSIRYAACKNFSGLLTRVLGQEGSFFYPFDSLVTMARLMSPDHLFRIFNWNLPKDDGTYDYYAIIQFSNKAGKDYQLISLEDKSDDIVSPETALCSPGNWVGALYYKIILKKHRHRLYYTLLGWDGNNWNTRKKIIEILTFDPEGTPVFGAPVFTGNQQDNYMRIIFEYKATAPMSLKYELQAYERGHLTGNPSNTRKIRSQMIVFDHLIPLDESLKGQYKFYVPSGDVFDAFVFKKGHWVFVPDVDARNRDSKAQPPKKKAVDYHLFPPEK